MLKYLVFVLIICISSIVNADTKTEMSVKTLFKKYKDSVVKITLYKDGRISSFGTGFFVGGNGEIITNAHVFEDALEAKERAVITTKSGKEFKDIKVANCRDGRMIDLCLIKINHKPKVYINSFYSADEVGEKLITLGHPKGYEWSISEGVIAGIRQINSYYQKNKNNSIKQVQVTAPISSGNSGGPILDLFGKLVGVSSWILTSDNSQNVSFSIHSQEVQNYLKKYSNFYSLKEFKKKMRKTIQQQAIELNDYLVKPHLKNLMKGVKPKSNASFDYLNVTWKNKNIFKFPLFKQFPQKDCSTRNLKKNTVVEVRCQSKDGNAVFFSNINFNPGKKMIKSIYNAEGTKIKPDALLEVEKLKKSGEWEKINKKYSKEVIKKHYYSEHRPFRCKKIKSGPSWAVLKGAYKCETFSTNYIYKGWISYSMFIVPASEKYVLQYNIIFSSPFWADFYQPLLNYTALASIKINDHVISQDSTKNKKIKTKINLEEGIKKGLYNEKDRFEIYKKMCMNKIENCHKNLEYCSTRKEKKGCAMYFKWISESLEKFKKSNSDKNNNNNSKL